MFEMKKITLIFATLLAAALFTTASAQHTVGLLGGAGYATARLYPKQEMKPIIGGTNFGLSHTAKRKHRVRKLILCHGIQYIALILCFV